MSKDYKISNDGTIFEIKEDGSISKIARIDDAGNISSISGKISGTQQSGKGKFWFFIVILLISTVVFGALYLQANDDLSYYKREYYKSDDRLTEAKRELSNIKDDLTESESLVNKLSQEFPMIITDIQIANVYYGGDIETDYGDKIYDYNTMYLKPRIKYIGFVSGTRELKVKWYKPDGTIRRGSKSPDGFSQSSEEYISTGNNTLTLSGWGNENKGHWDYGTHRIEIWYKNTCLKSKTFKIY